MYLGLPMPKPRQGLGPKGRWRLLQQWTVGVRRTMREVFAVDRQLLELPRQQWSFLRRVRRYRSEVRRSRAILEMTTGLTPNT